MTLSRYRPFEDVLAGPRDIVQWMDNFMPAFMKAGNKEGETAAWAPVVDIRENDTMFNIEAELAGMKKEDVTVNFQDGMLTISGERSYEKKLNGNGDGKDEVAHRVERFYGKFYRQFSFPVPVDGAKIHATFENGVLKIEVPKVAEARPAVIPID